MSRSSPPYPPALSLHAPNQTLREKIVPTATAYKLPALMDALDYYLASGPKVKTMVRVVINTLPKKKKNSINLLTPPASKGAPGPGF